MNIKKLFLSFAALAIFGFASCQNPKLDNGLYAKITIPEGNIILRLDYQNAPMTAANFVALAEGTMKEPLDSQFQSKKFYDGLVFHRVIRDFMIQGGDPMGTGAGGPGYSFPDEFTSPLTHKSGVLSMANSGPNTNGSQFFITEKETPWLDGKHTVFGEIIDSSYLAIVKKVGQGSVMKVSIIRVGKDAKAFDAPKVFVEQKAKAEEKAAAEAKAKEEAFNKMVETVVKEKDSRKENAAVKLPSGVRIFIEEMGEGENIKAGQGVTMQYTGILDKTGEVFDSSALSGSALRFIASSGGMINGFDEAVLQLKKGSKATIFIPYQMAYGDEEAGEGLIPARSDLIFNVEIEDVVNLPQQ